MIKDSYTNKAVKPDYSNKVSEINLIKVRNKCRDFLNKSLDVNLVTEIYKICLNSGMDK